MKRLFCIASLLAAGGWGIVSAAHGAPASDRLGHRSAMPQPPGGVAAQTTYLADLAAQMKRVWPHNRTINIVCHGHSVPAGYFKTPRVDIFNAYPHLIHRALNQRYPNAVINVIVTAIGGEAAESGAARFERDVLGHQPDVVLIDYALNDRGLGLARARAAWAKMIEQAQARGVKVFLVTPTGYLGANFDDPKSDVAQHAEQIRGLARQYHCGLVDAWGEFGKYVRAGGKLEDLMSQCNHPNREGHALVAAAALKWFPE
jgi:acyl-CoA thioesterase I